MPFARERDMSPAVVRWLRKQQLDVKSEFALPWGVADFVAVSLNPARVGARLGLRQFRPIGPLVRVELLRRIPDVETGDSVTLRELELAYRSDFAGPDVVQEINRLVHDRFVFRSGRGGFQKLNGWAPLHDRIVAVELKLERVGEALAQAVSNRAFATESYVALPMDTARKLADGSRSEIFRDAGVGILGISARRCESLLASTDCRAPVDAALQMHCVERFWRTKDNSA